MGRIGLNTAISGLTGKLIIRWVKASAPLAEVGRLPAANFPYDAVDVLIDLDPVVYIVQWWRSDDGVALSQLIKDWSIDAGLYNETIIRTYQYVVDRGDGDSGVWADPVDLDTGLVDTRLDGATKDELLVHEAGYGNKIDAEYELLPGGGISLNDGKTFDTQVRWFITWTRTLAQSGGGGSGSGSGGSGKYTGVELLANNRDFYVDPTDNLYNKLCIADFAGTVGTITFGAFELIPDNTLVTFQTHKGAQNYLRLQFNPGDTVRYLNADVNYIDLAKGENITLYFFAGACYVDTYKGRALQRGQAIVDNNPLRADNGACLLADEATGVLDAADYPALYEIIAAMTSGVAVLGVGVGQWGYDSGGGVYPNKRKFGINTGAETFRVPHLTGVTMKIGAAADIGKYEADNVGSFSGNLSIKKGWSYTGGPNNATHFGNGDPGHGEDKNVPFSYTPAIIENRVKAVIQTAYIIL